MKKSDVETRAEGGRDYPALNVKMYHVAMPETASEQAKEWALNAYVRSFWEDIEPDAQEILGSGVKVYQAGRSGGWMIVYGLPPVESWDAVQLSKWAKFARVVRAAVDYLKTEDARQQFAEDIEVNRWDEDGAEPYNFATLPDGRTVCISEMKAQAKAAGFGPVVRR